MSEASKELRCDGTTIEYVADGRLAWSVKVSEVRLIGEYTNSDGPYIDDYFFVFLTHPENGWHEASFYAGGANDTLAVLSGVLGSRIEAGLCNSTSYKTRILWPERLRDKEMMDVLPPEKRPWWRNIFTSPPCEIRPSKYTLEAFREAQPGATDNPDDAQRLREDH